MECYPASSWNHVKTEQMEEIGLPSPEAVEELIDFSSKLYQTAQTSISVPHCQTAHAPAILPQPWTAETTSLTSCIPTIQTTARNTDSTPYYNHTPASMPNYLTAGYTNATSDYHAPETPTSMPNYQTANNTRATSYYHAPETPASTPNYQTANNTRATSYYHACENPALMLNCQTTGNTSSMRYYDTLETPDSMFNYQTTSTETPTSILNYENATNTSSRAFYPNVETTTLMPNNQNAMTTSSTLYYSTPENLASIPSYQCGKATTPETTRKRSPTIAKNKPKRKKAVHWSDEEHKSFLAGLEAKGKGAWKWISKHFVKTKTSTQVASHAQKYFLRLQKNSKVQQNPKPASTSHQQPNPEPASTSHQQPNPEPASTSHQQPNPELASISLQQQNPESASVSNQPSTAEGNHVPCTVQDDFSWAFEGDPVPWTIENLFDLCDSKCDPLTSTFENVHLSLTSEGAIIPSTSEDALLSSNSSTTPMVPPREAPIGDAPDSSRPTQYA